jgi:hypothetical protein
MKNLIVFGASIPGTVFEVEVCMHANALIVPVGSVRTSGN